jgi:malonyl-CoA O-methyltransferase
MPKVTPQKTLIEERFGRRLSSYNKAAIVQRTMAHTLVERLSKNQTSTPLDTVLELGCGTGVLTESLLKAFEIKHLIANDLATVFDRCIQPIVQQFSIPEYEFLCGDMEQVVLPNPINLIVSNAAFQWLNDPKAFLIRALEHLAPGGFLAFTSFGLEQYTEISSLTGNQLDYLTLDSFCNTLSAHGTTLYAYEDHVAMDFQSPMAVLGHIRDTGVNAVQRRFWTRRDLRDFVERYQKQFPYKQGVRLTYNPIYVIFQKDVK